MTNNIQTAIEALNGLEFQFSKLSDKDWTATFEIIRTAVQRKPIDVDLKELEKKYTPSFNNDGVIGWNNCLKYLRENGYLITKEDQ